jgi:2,4-dienoyl-CoA reductase-like NADH-dependent reductase (Old Yellow Enzyme family)
MKTNDALTLPCGTSLPNRIAKSAMSENMAGSNYSPGIEFYNAYKTWSDGKVGLCITGNVMVDSNHLGESNNVVIEKGLDNLKDLRKWATASDKSDNHIWVQLNHPGKQSPKFINATPVGPSATPLISPLDKMFNKPRELAEEEIQDIINRFGYAAKVVRDCGFEGVQIHGAHGYLVSQFLSTTHNKRSDKWGGSIENRMRFVTEIYKRMREMVGESFPIGIKINSSDFGRGGFSHEEAIFVARSLSELGIDLIELSGGSYEAPVMTGAAVKKSTSTREAYFLEYAKDVKKNISCPLMVTGGFRSGEFINSALSSGQLDLVGLGRALCLNPNFVKQLIAGEDVVSEVKPLTSRIKLLDQIFPLEIIWYTMQIHRMGKGLKPKPNAGVYSAIINSAMEIGLQSINRVRS